jgi:hypothetical protein
MMQIQVNGPNGNRQHVLVPRSPQIAVIDFAQAMDKQMHSAREWDQTRASIRQSTDIQSNLKTEATVFTMRNQS